MTGGGGEGARPGIFLCLNFGGAIGSSCLATILNIRSFFLQTSVGDGIFLKERAADAAFKR